MAVTRPKDLVWISAPLVVYFFILQHLWFNAPVWDDYDTILGLLIRADEIRTPGEWLDMIFGQHNEHRIAVTRLITLALARSFGAIDFRVLMLIGNLAVLGTFIFIWLEFRGCVPAPAIGAAAIMMFQWSYYEASLMGSAALPHLGVVFFSFGCLYFALRDDRLGVAIGVIFGILAAASQANGLFALPIAAAACALFRRRWQAALFGILALLAWILYFRGYVRPPNHPSLLVALSSPIATIKLFLVVVGGVVPGANVPMFIGALVVGGLAWVTRKGFWKDHPVAALWTIFLLATAAAAAIGRVGFGVWQASRYAIGSTCLLIILCLAICVLTKSRGRRLMTLALIGAAGFSFAVSLKAWPGIRDSTMKGNLLKEAIPASAGFPVDRYGGAYYPDPVRAKSVLTIAAERGYYFPPKQLVYPSRIVVAKSLPQSSRDFGHIDSVAVSGTRVSVTGWTDITALSPARTMHVISSAEFREAGPVAVVARPDVVFALRDPDTLFSGFRLELDYASEKDAREGATTLCMVVEAPDRPKTRLAALQPNCGS